MYPLNMNNGVGFALANDAAEHKTLSEAGYEPALDGAEVHAKADDLEELRAQADAKGITYDRRWGVKRLRELLA